MTDLRRRIAKYVAYLCERANGLNPCRAKQAGLLTQPSYRADYISNKWCRIVRIEDDGSQSSYCHVALAPTRFGTSEGSIHKGYWKTAVKTKKGHVMDAQYDNYEIEEDIVITKPARKPRTKLTARTIRKELAIQTGIDKDRIRAEWWCDGYRLYIHLEEPTDEEIALVQEYGDKHRERWGYGIGYLQVIADGEHDPSVVGRKAGIEILDRMLASGRTRKGRIEA